MRGVGLHTAATHHLHELLASELEQDPRVLLQRSRSDGVRLREGLVDVARQHGLVDPLPRHDASLLPVRQDLALKQITRHNRGSLRFQILSNLASAAA